MIPLWMRPRAEQFRFLPPERATLGALPWIIALMTLLAALGIAGSIALASGVEGLGSDLDRRFTVQIVEPNPDLMTAKTERVVALLRAEPGIGAVRPLADEELQALVEPWLGSADLGEDLALPAMVDAVLKDSDKDLDAFGTRLAEEVPEARLDDHGDWLRPVGRLGWALAAIGLVLALLVALATAAIVVLGVRAGLGRHRATIEVLHLMGAEDRVISALFQYRLGLVGLIGAALGFVAALAAILTVSVLIGRLGSGLVGAAYLPWWGWLLLTAVPIAAVLLTMTTARVTVERALRRML